jgi:uncharacterized protein (DUF2384 family)
VVPEDDRLARVVAMAESAWQDAAEVRRSLHTPHPELNGRTPAEVAKTKDGVRKIERVLQRGRHGFPA